MAARTAGIDRNEEIASASPYVCTTIGFDKTSGDGAFITLTNATIMTAL